MRKDLMQHLKSFTSLNEEQVAQAKRDIASRVLAVTYMAASHDSVTPLRLQPDGLTLSDYQFEVYAPSRNRYHSGSSFHEDEDEIISHSSQLSSSTRNNNAANSLPTITEVQCTKDFAHVKFTAVLSNTNNPLVYSTPIEIFTSQLNFECLNCIHLHLTDTSKALKIDSVNLTNSAKTLDQVSEFKADMSGKLIDYRIVVKDGKIIAVLFPSHESTAMQGGKQIAQHASFVERPVPAVGSLVRLTDGRLATVSGLPIGLLVSTEDELKRQESQEAQTTVGSKNEIGEFEFKRSGQCTHKHPADLRGFIDIQVVAANASTLLEQPIKLNVPLCHVTDAPEEQQMIDSMRLSAQQAEAHSAQHRVEQFLSDLEQLESGVRDAEQGKQTPPEALTPPRLSSPNSASIAARSDQTTGTSGNSSGKFDLLLALRAILVDARETDEQLAQATAPYVARLTAATQQLQRLQRLNSTLLRQPSLRMTDSPRTKPAQ